MKLSPLYVSVHAMETWPSRKEVLGIKKDDDLMGKDEISD